MNGRGPSPILAAGLLLLVAVLGLLGGVVLDRTVLRHHGPHGEWVSRPGLHRSPNGPLRGPRNGPLHGRVRERIAMRLAEDLDLSASQREQVSTVLERQEERLAEAMAETRPRINRILEETHQEIHAILTPEQRERFEDMWTAHHGRRLPMPHRGRADTGR